MNYLSLISYASQSWSKDGGALYPNTSHAERRAWLDDLSALVDNIGPTSHQITSILTLLSASVRQGSSLPPHLELPQPYDLSRRLEALDKGILDSRHVEEPGYSAYGESSTLFPVRLLMYHSRAPGCEQPNHRRFNKTG